MTFPLVIFLYGYFVFLVIWAILSLIGFYHLVRFGGRMFGSFFVGVLYLAGSLILMYLSYFYFSSVNWQTQVSIFENVNNLRNIFDSSIILN